MSLKANGLTVSQNTPYIYKGGVIMKTELKEVRKEFGKHDKLLCPKCRKLVSYNIFERETTGSIDGAEIKYNEFYSLCDEFKFEISVSALDDNNEEIFGSEIWKGVRKSTV